MNLNRNVSEKILLEVLVTCSKRAIKSNLCAKCEKRSFSKAVAWKGRWSKKQE